MVGWRHWLDGHEFEQALGVGDGQGSLACCSPWGHKESDTTERLNWTALNPFRIKLSSPSLTRPLPISDFISHHSSPSLNFKHSNHTGPLVVNSICKTYSYPRAFAFTLLSARNIFSLAIRNVLWLLKGPAQMFPHQWPSLITQSLEISIPLPCFVL